FDLADEMGNWLDKPRPESASALELKAPLTPVSQRYAEREGIVLHGHATVKNGPTGSLWHQPRISHAIFGSGTVTREDESSFEVHFDGGDLLNFSKKSAHLYFTPLAGSD
ncbi:MAG TPA: ATP-dependent helicase, partial [Marinobacter sp.]|nr:ATP-dependent helicase [Marinobacter sp.]